MEIKQVGDEHAKLSSESALHCGDYAVSSNIFSPWTTIEYWMGRYLEGALKVSITLPYRNDFSVDAEDFAKAINAVLQSQEGTTMRERIEIYNTSIGADLGPGGSSYEAILKFVNLIKGGSVFT